MKRLICAAVLVCALAPQALAQRGVSIRFDLSPRDTLISTAADTQYVDLATGRGEICGPITVFMWAQKLSDSIMLTVYYDVAGDTNSVTGSGWWTLDSTLIVSDIAGAGETKLLMDTLFTTNVQYAYLRTRVVGGASNDKTAGSAFTVTGIGQRCK
ncbi:MAG TPA: hypothetical protein VNA25_06815 [Phycisphaerae bacterium]|nr:hypothetical protein [Phycisphaerae bacterium]